MHRALLIEVGQTFEPAFERLRKQLAGRIETGHVSFVDAPMVGDGNLSRPVGRLQDSLENTVADALAPLLRLQPGERGEIRLDVFVCADCGERRAVEAALELIESTVTQLQTDYATVFPAHRDGLERGARVFPIFVLPHNRDADRPRAEAIEQVGAFLDALPSASDTFVDRVFVLDAVTARGVAPASALVEQVETFLRVATEPTFRNDDTLLGALDRPCSGRLASFGAARFELPIDEIWAVAASEAGKELIASLAQGKPEEFMLPAPEELAPSFAILRDDALERAVEALEGVVERVIRQDGFAAVEATAKLAVEVEERIAAWRAAGLTRRDDDASASELARTDADGEPRLLAFFGSLLLGGAMVAVAHFAIGMTMAASFGIGSFFMLCGLVFAFFVIRLVQAQNEEVLATMELDREAPVPNNQLTPEQRLDLLTSAAVNARSQANRILAQLEGLTAWDADPTSRESRPWSWKPDARPLGELAYAATRRHSTAGELGQAFLETLPDLKQMLRGNARIEMDAVERFAREYTLPCREPRVASEPDIERELRNEFEQFVETWRDGATTFWEPNREHVSRPARTPVRNLLFAPAPMEALVEHALRTRETALTLQRCGPQRLEICLLTVDCDLEQEGMTTFGERTKRGSDE